MQKLFCLSFMQAFTGQMAHIPPPVDRLVKNHVLQQLKLASEESFSFDEAQCPQKGTYIYSGDAMVLVANEAHWRGRAEIPLHDALDGRKLFFPPLSAAHDELLAATATSTVPPSSAHARTAAPRSRKWMGWALAGVGVLVGGLILAQKNKSRSPEGPSPTPGPPPETDPRPSDFPYR